MPGTVSTNPGVNLNAAQFAAMPPDQQAAYLKNLPPSQQAAMMKDVRVIGNRKFMRHSVEKYAYCPVSGGSGVTAAYSPGTTIVFDLPVVGSGYAKGLLVTYSLTLTLGGTTPVVQANAAAPWNIFQEVLLNYNGAQCRFHPYLLKVMDMALGFSRGAQNAVLAGQAIATINNNIVSQGSGALPVTTGSVWSGKFLIRLNAIDEFSSIPGMLPIMGIGNKPQLKLTPASSTLGFDPLLSPVSTVSGTNVTASFAGNINVDVIYYDGTTMDDVSGLTLDLTAEPTLQYYWDTPLNPLTSNTLVRQHIATLLEHWMVVSIVIDGLQSTAFSTLGNIQQLQLSADSVGQQNFQSYNVSNNISIYDYYDRNRRRYGQDLDPGVIPWIDAATHNIADSDNRNGVLVLNMQAGGYPATTHAYQVGSVSSANTTPRVETFLVSMNYAGLKIA